MPKISKEQLSQIEEYISTLPVNERESKMKEIIKQFEEEPAQCPFCLMSEGKIKTTKIFEDSEFMAVLEINPANVGHTLLFPKKHVRSYSDLFNDDVKALSVLMRKIEFSLLNIFGNVNILISDGEVSGQKFEHCVVNLIPRVVDDSVVISWKAVKSDDKTLDSIKNKIIASMPVEASVKKEIEEVKPDDLRKKLFKKILP